MGLFTRRRRTDPVPPSVFMGEWLPVSNDVIVAPGAQMDDDSCAGESAYGVRFCCESALDASLTIWSYAIPGGPATGDSFIVAFRTEYEVGLAGEGEVWSASLYGSDVAGTEWHDDVNGADRGAWIAAHTLLRDGRITDWAVVPESVITEALDWDGVPW
jgi:hypothetical protein